MKPVWMVIFWFSFVASALAEPKTYKINSKYTYSKFVSNQFDGKLIVNGKFNKNYGKIILDRIAKTGTLEIEVKTSSIDFGKGKEELSTHVKSADILDVDNFPGATYKGMLVDFKNEKPTAADGFLTLHGVTRPLRLSIDSFRCSSNAIKNNEICDADASAVLDRKSFGIAFGEGYGLNMNIQLAIRVEAVSSD